MDRQALINSFHVKCRQTLLQYGLVLHRFRSCGFDIAVPKGHVVSIEGAVTTFSSPGGSLQTTIRMRELDEAVHPGELIISELTAAGADILGKRVYWVNTMKHADLLFLDRFNRARRLRTLGIGSVYFEASVTGRVSSMIESAEKVRAILGSCRVCDDTNTDLTGIAKGDILLY